MTEFRDKLTGKTREQVGTIRGIEHIKLWGSMALAVSFIPEFVGTIVYGSQEHASPVIAGAAYIGTMASLATGVYGSLHKHTHEASAVYDSMNGANDIVPSPEQPAPTLDEALVQLMAEREKAQ